ncbi:MAG: SusD/RagB family nutrient-binding outer membrane lipoprotein [Bacteroidales bacterium]|nr:SusD/RagB family nutrient-binding outer membrane lipoprotein [Bacteroidales bacterium]
MKRKIISYFAAVLLMLVIFSPGCTEDFEEINSNPNSPAISQAAPDMLLTNAIESMTDRVHEIFFGHEMGSCWVQHMAKVQYPDEDKYVPRMSVINNTWNSFFSVSGYDVQVVYNIGVAKNNDSYKAVALILKSYIVSVLTDEFGDIPYSEAFRGADATPILSPVFDTQESIYAALLANLEEANTLLKEDGPEIGGDILFGNDLMKWKKFANSLRLRLLLRQSDRIDPTTAMKTIVNDPDTYPIFESIDDNAALVYLGSAPNNNPINENRKTRDDHRVSKTLVDYMYTNAVIDYDYRIFVYAEPAEGPNDFVGLPNGMNAAAAAAYNGNGISNTSKIGRYFSAAEAPGMLMSYPELQFILAEAAARGFLTGSPDLTAAESYYNEGVTSSTMTYATEIGAAIGRFYGAAADKYVPGSGGANDPLLWFLEGDGVFDPANALKQIATQKWVAMFDQGIQAEFEWKRTGYPILTPAIAGQNGGKIPVRAYYPSDEAGRNPTNYAAAVARQGADDLNTRVWWDTKDNF